MTTYDIAITGGRVIDPETGLDAVRNVGIQGEKIAAVTEKGDPGQGDHRCHRARRVPGLHRHA